MAGWRESTDTCIQCGAKHADLFIVSNPDARRAVFSGHAIAEACLPEFLTSQRETTADFVAIVKNLAADAPPSFGRIVGDDRYAYKGIIFFTDKAKDLIGWRDMARDDVQDLFSPQPLMQLQLFRLGACSRVARQALRSFVVSPAAEDAEGRLLGPEIPFEEERFFRTWTDMYAKPSQPASDIQHTCGACGKPVQFPGTGIVFAHGDGYEIPICSTNCEDTLIGLAEGNILLRVQTAHAEPARRSCYGVLLSGMKELRELAGMNVIPNPRIIDKNPPPREEPKEGEPRVYDRNPHCYEDIMEKLRFALDTDNFPVPDGFYQVVPYVLRRTFPMTMVQNITERKRKQVAGVSMKLIAPPGGGFHAKPKEDDKPMTQHEWPSTGGHELGGAEGYVDHALDLATQEMEKRNLQLSEVADQLAMMGRRISTEDRETLLKAWFRDLRAIDLEMQNPRRFMSTLKWLRRFGAYLATKENEKALDMDPLNPERGSVAVHEVARRLMSAELFPHFAASGETFDTPWGKYLLAMRRFIGTEYADLIRDMERRGTIDDDKINSMYSLARSYYDWLQEAAAISVDSMSDTGIAPDAVVNAVTERLASMSDRDITKRYGPVLSFLPVPVIAAIFGRRDAIAAQEKEERDRADLEADAAARAKLEMGEEYTNRFRPGWTQGEIDRYGYNFALPGHDHPYWVRRLEIDAKDPLFSPYTDEDADESLAFTRAVLEAEHADEQSAATQLEKYGKFRDMDEDEQLLGLYQHAADLAEQGSAGGNFFNIRPAEMEQMYDRDLNDRWLSLDQAANRREVIESRRRQNAIARAARENKRRRMTTGSEGDLEIVDEDEEEMS